MKKSIKKSIVAMAVLSASILGGMEAYSSYEEVSASGLMTQNVEALTQNDAEGSGLTVCLGLWGPCSINGNASKAPLANYN
ncbi:MAG: hypothetical protein IK003_06385 [Prevotella sp.]|nr:hypothetical protein [Prevotella sp.]